VSGAAVIANISVYGWQVSVLVRMGRNQPLVPLARESDPGFVFVHQDAVDDGTWFYGIARDPLATGPEHLLVEHPAYRYGNGGYGLLGWLVSGGQPRAVPGALLAIALASIAVTGGVTSLLAREFGWSPWWGLLAAFHPGLVTAATALTSEALGAAVLGLSLLAWVRRRWGWAAVFLAYLCLIKQQLVLVPAGLALWEAIEYARGRLAPDWKARLTALAPCPIVFGLWMLYVREKIGIWPFLQGSDRLSYPFVGWLESLQVAAEMGTTTFHRMELGRGNLPVVVVVAALLAFGMVRAARLRTPLDPIYLLLSTLSFCLLLPNVLYLKDMTRTLALVFLLLPAVIANPRGWLEHRVSRRPREPRAVVLSP